MALTKLNEDMISETLKSPEEKERKAVKTGLIDLDYALGGKNGGLYAGETYLLGSRPEVAKTQFALNLVRTIALEQGKTIVYFSLSRSRNHLLWELLEDLKDEASREQLKGANIYIEDRTYLSAPEIAYETLSVEESIDLIIIDDVFGLRHINHDLTIEKDNTALTFKTMAEKINCPVLMLYKVFMNPKSWGMPATDSRDLCDMAWNHISDNILFLNRKILPGGKQDRRVEMKILKNNNGEKGTVYLLWNEEERRFKDYDSYKI